MELLVDALLSVVVAVALWTVLPRGVVLTRSFPATNAGGEILLDTWTIRNDSSLPVRITSMAIRGLTTVNQKTQEIEWRELDGGSQGSRVAEVWLEDEVSEIRRLDRATHWNKILIPPGDIFRARVLNNTDLRIRYRRAGWLGVFERRTLTISGGA